MKNISPDISTLFDNYSKHEWIDLTKYPEYPIDDDTTLVDLNLQCKNIIKEWLETNRGLPSVEDFPYSGEPDNDRLVSQIVNGFCLKIDNKSKVIFIPSEQLDIDSFEVAQEWVDLPEWMGDYYVPIQVDVDAQHLHLWGMITHQELKQVEEPDDEMFRYYNVDADRTIDNLEVLWTSCELAPEPRSKNIPKLVTQGIESLIDRVKSEAGSNFDRLILGFREWGAILNDRYYLNQYFQLQVLVTASANNKLTTPLVALSRRFQQSGSAVAELINATYVAFKDFPGKPLLTPGFMGWEQNNPDWLSSLPVTMYENKATPLDDSIYTPKSKFALFAVLGNDLSTEAKIQEAINSLYENQDPANEVTRPSNLDSPKELLIYLMQHTKNETLRWEVAGCLWQIDPDVDNSPYWQRQITELGSITQGRKLGLMTATIPLPDRKTYAILAHTYEIDNQELPSNVRLTLLSEENQQIDQSESRPQDPYVRLYFTATIGDRFNICISVNNLNITEAFEVQR
jgi:hypothetical protein